MRTEFACSRGLDTCFYFSAGALKGFQMVGKHNIWLRASVKFMAALSAPSKSDKNMKNITSLHVISGKD